MNIRETVTGRRLARYCPRMPTPLRRVALPVLLASALMTPLALVAPASAAPVQAVTANAAAVGAVGTYVAVDPVRLVDTRSGLGGRVGKLGQGGSMVFDPAAGGNTPPAGQVAAVLLNVTGTEPTNSTFLTLYPTGTTRPGTSSVNLVAGQTRPNQVVVPVGPDGKVQLFNNAGSTHAVVDLQGFYSTATGVTGGTYLPVEPTRVIDTREPDQGEVFPFTEGETGGILVDAPGVGADTSAVEVNITVTEPTASGYLTAWDGSTQAPPTASNLNFVPGQTVANHVVVPVSFDGLGRPFIALFNSRGNTHVIVDVIGRYDDGSRTDGLRFEPAVPRRVLDTRDTGSRVAAGATVRVPATGLPAAAKAHVVNLTATDSVGAGFALAWSGDGAKPFVSTVNFVRGEDSPNLATAAANSTGGFAVSAGSSAVHLIADYQGYFY